MISRILLLVLPLAISYWWWTRPAETRSQVLEKVGELGGKAYDSAKELGVPVDDYSEAIQEKASDLKDRVIEEMQDPKSEYFKRVREWSGDLIQQHAQTGFGKEVARKVQAALASQSDWKKDAALKVLSQHRMNLAQVKQVIAGLRTSNSKRLYADAMPILQNYSQEPYRSEVRPFLIEQMRHGGSFVGEEIAKKFAPFMSLQDKDLNSTIESMPIEVRRILNGHKSELEFRESGG